MYPEPPSVTVIVPLTLPLDIVGVASFAPPGCLNVILGTKVYPLPELSISRLLIAPFVTTAVILAFLDPVLVGFWIITSGGLVSLYPLPPSSKLTLLIPFTSAVAAAPEPIGLLIETLGGYLYWYPDPVWFILIDVRVPALLIRAYPTAPLPKSGIGASIEYKESILPFKGASLKMNTSPSTKKSTFGSRSLLSYTAIIYSSAIGS